MIFLVASSKVKVGVAVAGTSMVVSGSSTVISRVSSGLVGAWEISSVSELLKLVDESSVMPSDEVVDWD